MAAAITLNSIWRARVACYLPNQASINVLYYICTEVGGEGGVDGSFAAGLDTLFAPLFKALLCEAAFYRGVSVQRVSPAPPTLPSVVTVNDGAGTVAGDLLPAQVSGVITKQTPFAGVKFRGRLYCPFPGEADNTSNAPTAGYLSRLNDLAQSLTDVVVAGVAGDTSTMAPCLWHRSDGSITLLTAVRTNALWGTQRRRGNYGKLNLAPF